MQNLIENRSNKGKKDEEDVEEKKKRPVIKSATDLQRLKLEKLMKNPEKPIVIPEQPKEKDYMQTVPSFVRNVMGSSAGAGSGEFHVYRHLRRKEYARQKCIQAKSMREQLDDEYQSKLEKNRLEAEAKTAKKRAKRMKKKLRAKKPKTRKNDENDDEKQDSSEDDSEKEQEEDTVSAGASQDAITEDEIKSLQNRQEARQDVPENGSPVSGVAEDSTTKTEGVSQTELKTMSDVETTEIAERSISDKLPV